ncbi:MAG: T9SS type A sorting domain-containing protein [Bacteroidota bacterium]
MKKILLSVFAIASFSYAHSQCSELFISEYVEGNYNNKAIEIYNPTSAPINLSAYRLIRWQNGSATADQTATFVLNLTGSIASHDVKVFVIDRRVVGATGQDTVVFADLQAKADTFACPDYNVNSTLSFNGDDAMSLQKNNGGTWTNVDIFGVIGERPTTAWTDTDPYNDGTGEFLTKDKSLVRKSTITSGVTTNPASFNTLAEWDVFDMNTFTNLQTHDCSCNQTSVNEISSTSASFLPNPVNSNLVVTSKENIQSIKVIDVLGKSIYSSCPKTNTISINFQSMENGIYFVIINAGENQITQKVVKN